MLQISIYLTLQHYSILIINVNMNNRSRKIMTYNLDYTDIKRQFIYWMESQGWSKRTIETYSYNSGSFRDYLTDTVELHSIYDLNPQIIYKYQHDQPHRRSKTQRPLAMTTIHTNLVAVRSFLNFLCQQL